MTTRKATIVVKRKASSNSVADFKPPKRQRGEHLQAENDAGDLVLTNEKLCDDCPTTNLEELFRRKTKVRDGFWGANVGNPASDSTCPLCRFLAAMIPLSQPPTDEKSLQAYRSWKDASNDYFLVAFSPSQVFGVPERKPSDRALKDLVGSLVAVLPGWIRTTTYAKKNSRYQYWEDVRIFPGFILTEDTSTEPRGFSGRVVSPHAVDVEIILAWIRYCDEKHKKHCAPTTDSAFRCLKVIDCEARKIVIAPRGCLYVALSYVWGIENSSSTSTQPGSLPEPCSQVIEDAIQIVKRLNHRYLWVDRYCIDQNDEVDKHHQIANMDSIYAGAYLTIISAAGDSASDGLPGVGTTPRASQPRVLVGDRHLVSSLPNPAKTIPNSKWMSRAWTYQEGLLSKRRLVFTEHQVYFQCSSMHCFESMNLPLDFMHTKPGRYAQNSRFCEGTKFARVFPLVNVARRADDYLNRVNEYVQRDLSYDCDALNAILGVLKVFERSILQVYHHWGIPLFSVTTKIGGKTDWNTSYAIGLAWELDTTAERRHGLPSWSWVGWKNWKRMSFPQAEFGPYRVDPKAAGSSHFSHPQTHRSHLQVEVDVENVRVPCIEDDHPNIDALSASSPLLYITSWTTELHLRRTDNGEWDITNQDDAHVNLESVHMTEKIDPGEYRWKALFLGCRCGDGSPYAPWCAPIFLLLKKIENCFERVGICTFTMKTFFYVSINKACLGELELGRERIELG